MITKMLQAEGSLDSTIVFVQDHPTEKDVFSNEYFSGYAGEMFNMLLGRAGIMKHNTYRTSLIKCPITRQQFAANYLSKGKLIHSKELDAWTEYLRRELSETGANVIVPLGELSLYVLTGKRMHSKQRGSILPCSLILGRKVIPCLSPVILQASYGMMPFIQFDLQRIKKESNDRIIEVETSDFIIRPSFTLAMKTLYDMDKHSSILSWDIETAGDAVSCIGFTSDTHDGICIPLTIPYVKRYWRFAEEIQILRAIQKLLQNPTIKKGGQNIFYDMCWMIKTLNILPKNITWDTMIASHSCYCELKKDLGTLTSFYTKFPYYKDEGNVWKVGVNSDAFMTRDQKLDQYWLYNVKDCHRTMQIHLALEKEMEQLGVADVHKMVVRTYLPQCVYMTTRGMLYNKGKQAILNEEYRIKILALNTAMLQEYNLDDVFNLGSPTQVKKLMYEIWEMKPVISRKTHTTTVDAGALKSLGKKYPKHYPFITDLQKLRAMKKLRSTYLDLPVSEFDNRIHFGYNPVGTETGRYSSGQSPFRDGTNGQNIPDKTRHLITPDTGMVFINADLSQAEARIVAMLGQELRLLELFESGQDVHTTNACNIFGIVPEQAKEIFDGDKTYRDMGKRIVHASNYDMTAYTLAIQAQISRTKANELLEKYHATYPGIRRYHRWVQQELKSKKTLTTPFGRKRIFFGRLDNYTFKEAYAFIPQSTVGDILNTGAAKVFAEITDCELVLQVHDSIMVQCLPASANSIMQRMHDLLTMPITINGITHTIPVDFQIGYNWGKVKPNNPDGLKDWKINNRWKQPAGTESGIGARSIKDA